VDTSSAKVTNKTSDKALGKAHVITTSSAHTSSRNGNDITLLPTTSGTQFNGVITADTGKVVADATEVWGEMQDSRLLCSVILIWILAVLQVVFGMREFIGFVADGGNSSRMGWVGWYDEDIARAELEKGSEEERVMRHEKALERVKEDMRKKGRRWED
jgi:hypothetical protein